MTDQLFGADGIYGPDIRARVEHRSSLDVFEARGGKLPRRRPAPRVTEIHAGSVVEGKGWKVTVGHAPRCGQVQFYEIPFQAPLVLNVTREGVNVTLSWADPSDTAVLQSADAITGPWTDLLTAFSPYVVTPSSAQKYFRLQK